MKQLMIFEINQYLLLCAGDDAFHTYRGTYMYEEHDIHLVIRALQNYLGFTKIVRRIERFQLLSRLFSRIAHP
jgi:hypothetical protein